MAVTVSREGGPTVPVAYDPRRAKEHVPDWTRQLELFVLGTMVSIGQQLGTATSSWLKDVLAEVTTSLFAYVVEEKQWPAELGRAGASPEQEHPRPPSP